MLACRIKHEVEDSIDILRFEGALDTQSLPRLETLFNNLLSKQRHRIVLDCNGLDYINSASLGSLIGFARKVRDQGGDLKVTSLSQKITGIVNLLGFDKILSLYPDVETATAGFVAEA